jgi:lantibiotic modifying enzyme
MQKVYNHISKGAQLTEYGATWNGKNFKSLVGFAHGNAGFILALSKYYNVTKNEEALELIEKALNYNKHFYSSVSFKWLDLRSEIPSEADATWCHGAAGIILSYIKSSKLLNRDLTSPYIVVAFNDIIQNGMSGQDCLCHGSLGNYEVLVSMAELLKNDELKNVVRNELYKKVISMSGRHENWITGLNNQQYSLIGLFLGLSGISYNIMRVFWQDDVPSVLTLDSPIFHH